MDLLYKHENKLFKIAAVIASIFWLALTLGTVGIALVYLLLMYVFFIFVHSAFISYLKGTGVKLSQQQYPSLYNRLVNNCEKIGIKEVPDAYILRTDFFNALATRFLGRNFVVLYSDVLDALDENESAVDFYVGHELGHIHRKHLTWGWFIAPALIFPLLGSAMRRSQEYTCDRYGAMCCDSEQDIVLAISAIAAGDSRAKTINAEAYMDQISETSGFWMSLNELTSDYPWLTKRMKAAVFAKRGETFKPPRRSFIAWLLSAFIPRFGAASGGASILIVIAVIGILASVAIPQYQNYIEKSRLVQAYSTASQLKAPIDQYALKNQAWPVALSDLNIEEADMRDDSNAFSVNIYEKGMIAANVGLSKEGETQYIIIEPSIVDGSIEWKCIGENIKSEQLPNNCK